jgi:NADPH-dependent 2,4-dienoyl-CoA reductase/sulfur reductase-like enzyme
VGSGALARLVVVGGDAAGMTAASLVRRAAPDVDVVVFERGPHTSYSMCGIPYYVGGLVAEAEDLVVRDPEAFRASGIDVRVRTEVVDVDAAARRVRVRDLGTGAESEEPYDLLLLATGAHPSIPDVGGIDAYAEPVRTLEEAMRLRARLDGAAAGHAASIDRAVVIGAGYIGIEMAEALVSQGIRTVLADRSPHAMKTLDPDMAAHVARSLVEFGVDLHLSTGVTDVRGASGRVTEVVTDQGLLQADLVVVAAGSRPAVALAVAAGCRLGSTGAVVVDDRMRTTVDGVWAAGDVVESVDLVAGLRRNVQLGTHANKQGKVAGIDIVAALGGGRGDAAFPGLVGTAVTRVCDREIARTGLTEAEAGEAGLAYATTAFESTARAGYLPEPGCVHVKMMAEQGSGRVLGCQLVGTGNVAKRIDVAATWCQLGVPVQEAQFLDLSYAPPFGGVWDLLQVGARKLVAELGLSPQL